MTQIDRQHLIKTFLFFPGFLIQLAEVVSTAQQFNQLHETFIERQQHELEQERRFVYR